MSCHVSKAVLDDILSGKNSFIQDSKLLYDSIEISFQDRHTILIDFLNNGHKIFYMKQNCNLDFIIGGGSFKVTNIHGATEVNFDDYSSYGYQGYPVYKDSKLTVIYPIKKTVPEFDEWW